MNVHAVSADCHPDHFSARLSSNNCAQKGLRLELVMCHHMILDENDHTSPSLVPVIYANTPLPILAWVRFFEKSP